MSAVDVDATVDGPEDAPVVVLANSLGAARGMWDPQVPALAERYRVVTYDMRGHGASPAPAGPYTLDDLVARLEAMIAGCDDEGYASCAEVVAGIDLREDLARIAAPTLVISGAEDQALPPAHQQAIAEGIAGAELLSVSPGAHLANLERTLEVTGALLGHFDAAGDDR